MTHHDNDEITEKSLDQYLEQPEGGVPSDESRWLGLPGSSGQDDTKGVCRIALST